MKKQISKVLFVGLGGVGQRHMRNFRQIMGDSVEILHTGNGMHNLC